MSRVSISRRLERIRDHLLVPYSLEWRVDRLPNALQDAYRQWQESNEAIISRAEKQPGDAYAALINGKLQFYPLPMTVQKVLFPTSGQVYDSVYHEYQTMIES